MSPGSKVEAQPRPIAPVDLAAERAAVGPPLEEAVLRVLRSGQYVLGPEVEALEREVAGLCGVAHAVGVASGTDALVLGLRALGVKPGDGVVTSPFTFFASAGVIAWIGARPLLADVDPETGLMDPAAAAAAVDGGTTALLPVHLYGQLADMRALRDLADARGLALLEDAAQAIGAARDGAGCGALGDAAALSFYPTKNLGAAGDGGLVLTRRENVAAALRRLRDHGSSEKYRHAEIGTNSRLAALQAAVLRTKLPHLEAWNARRGEIAARYSAAFESSDVVRPLSTVPGATHVFHQYTVRVSGEVPRDVVLEGLRADGIAAAVHYPLPVHFQEAAAQWGYRPGDLPQAEALAREVLCLPVHPFLSDADAERVSAAVLRLAGGA
jgi:dTDP-4-amino-4,6-dideoxygalactose transaminase